MIQNLLFLNLAELFERLAYYGIRSVLILFLINRFAIDAESVVSYYGTFTFAITVIAIISGLISDFTKKSFLMAIIGNLLSTLGIFTMSFASTESVALFGMALIALGSGLFKPAIIGSLFRAGFNRKHRLDLIFTIFYIAINLGAFAGPLLASFFKNDEAVIDFKGIFILMGCISAIPTILLLANYNKLNSNNMEYDNQSIRLSHFAVPKIALYFGITLVFWVSYELAPLFSRGINSTQTYSAIIGIAIIVMLIPFQFIPNFRSAMKISIGLLLAALACFVARSMAESPLIGITVFALAEMLIQPILLSQLIQAGSPKFTATIFAVFTAMSLLTNQLAGFMNDFHGNAQTTVLYFCGLILIALLVGLLLIDSKEKSQDQHLNR